MRSTRTAVAALLALAVLLSGVPAPAAAGSISTAATADDGTAPVATITVENGSVDVGRLSRIDVRVDVPNRTDGIGFLALELANTRRAEIVDADFRGPGDGTTHVVSNQYVSLDWSASNASLDGRPVVLSVFVRGIDPGETAIDITEVRNVRRGGGGTYEVERRNGTVTVDGGTDSGGGASTGTVELVAPPVTVGVGDTATLPIEVGNATRGLSAAEVTVALPDSVRVTGVTSPAGLSDVNVTRTGSGPVVRFAGVGYDAGGPTATVARIRIRGVEPAKTAAAVDLREAADRNNTLYDLPDGRLAAITVEGDGNATGTAPPALGNGAAGAAGDPDGDGRYEDVDGDGTVDVLDVAALLEAIDSDAVASNAAAFDFDGDGGVNVIDVAVLLEGV